MRPSRPDHLVGRHDVDPVKTLEILRLQSIKISMVRELRDAGVIDQTIDSILRAKVLK